MKNYGCRGTAFEVKIYAFGSPDIQVDNIKKLRGYFFYFFHKLRFSELQ